jgi:hypothetical protein
MKVDRMACAALLLLVGCAVTTQAAEPSSTFAPSPATAGAAVVLTGRWSFICCDRKYSARVDLFQTGDRLTGSLLDPDSNRTRGLEGTVSGHDVHITVSWEGPNRQDYVLVANADGSTLEGTLGGDRDPALGVDVHMIRIGSAPAPGAAAAVVLTGRWSLLCCDGKYRARVDLVQTGDRLTGGVLDPESNQIHGLEGTVSGHDVHITVSWQGPNRQDYVLVANADGSKLEGTLGGDRDRAFGVDVHMIRK